MMNLAINGFGRIGKLFFRAEIQDEQFCKTFNVVAVDDITDTKTLAHLLKYDSNFDRFKGEGSFDDQSLTVNGQKKNHSVEESS
jgi:glyceraldehyde 3-phosphate dehydrogenase